MSRELNRVYGVLTGGDNTVRKTTITVVNNSKLVTALIPGTVSAACKRALAELYIRLCMTDKELQYKLLKADPINSYKLQSFYEPFADTGVIDNVVAAIKKLGLPDEERSALPFDIVKNALDKLLDSLNG